MGMSTDSMGNISVPQSKIDFWVKRVRGVEFKNPLSCTILHDDSTEISRLREKYKNFDLPENFSEEELVELDEWLKQKGYD